MTDSPLSAREKRGRALSKQVRVTKHRDLENHWWVPSQSKKSTKYTVFLDSEWCECECPDFELRDGACKHIFAVEFFLRGVSPIKKKSASCLLKPAQGLRACVKNPKRRTYPQNWRAYNEAQMNEKDRVTELLYDLLRIVRQRPQGIGRPSVPLRDVILAGAMKTYLHSPGRFAMNDQRDLVKKGYMARVPHFNTVFRILAREKLTPLLKALVQQSAAPLWEIEKAFAVDSSGFSAAVYDRWYEHKYGGRVKSRNRWVKAHIFVGVKTGVVASIEVTPGTGPGTGDAPHLLPLTKEAAHQFEIAEVSADMAYLSRENVDGLAKLGIDTYIPFKVNSTEHGSETWRRLFHRFSAQREEFLQHYHKRSNVESTFGAIKRRLGGSVRSRTLSAQINEVILKALVHNLRCVVRAIYELGLDPTFWKAREDREENEQEKKILEQARRIKQRREKKSNRRIWSPAVPAFASRPKRRPPASERSEKRAS